MLESTSHNNQIEQLTDSSHAIIINVKHETDNKIRTKQPILCSSFNFLEFYRAFSTPMKILSAKRVLEI